MLITSMDALGKMIRSQRRRIPLSQQELADLSNLSRTSIQRIEGGIETTEFSTILKVLKVLNMSLELKEYIPRDIDLSMKDHS